MVAAHFEEIGYVVNAEPSGQPNEPLISLMLNSDPAIHGARSTGNIGAEPEYARKRAAVVEGAISPATAGGNLVTGRDSSRGRHSQLIEYRRPIVTTDCELSGGSSGAAPVRSAMPVAVILLPANHA